MLELLQVFYLATTVFSNIYITSSHTTLHNIYEITKYFSKYRDHNQLETIIVPIEVKFIKYYKKIPLLYYFEIVLINISLKMIGKYVSLLVAIGPC